LVLEYHTPAHLKLNYLVDLVVDPDGTDGVYLVRFPALKNEFDGGSFGHDEVGVE
jgi:hypothetical protein